MHESDEERYGMLWRELETPSHSIDIGFCPFPGTLIDAYERAVERRRSHGLPAPSRAERPSFGYSAAFAGAGRNAVIVLLRSAHAFLAAYAGTPPIRNRARRPHPRHGRY